MTIVKTPKTVVKKNKVRKFDLRTEFEPEFINLIDDEKFSAKELLEKSGEMIENCNKRLERVRLLCRAIECSANRNFDDISSDMNQEKINRTKGYYLETINSSNGIFIH